MKTRKIAGFAFIMILAFLLSWQSLNADTILKSMEKEFIKIVNNINPSIVEISAMKRNVGKQPFFPVHESIGTGVIIDERGYIVTTESVVGESGKIEVTLTDGRTIDAKIAGIDPETDIALIKINADNLSVIPLGNSDNVHTGSWIITIGRSYSKNHTLSFGIVNCTEPLPGKPAYYDAIRINANVSPGNSGGGVIDMDGKLVGIIAAAIAEPRSIDFEPMEDAIMGGPRMLRGRFFGGMESSFAIPINFVKKIVDDLIEDGEIERGWLGVFIRPIEYQNMKKLGLNTTEGVIAAKVLENAPAFKAGIQSGDVIVSFNNQKIKNPDDLTRMVAATKPRTRVNLTIIHDKQKQVVSVEIGKMPKNRPNEY